MMSDDNGPKGVLSPYEVFESIFNGWGARDAFWIGVTIVFATVIYRMGTRPINVSRPSWMGVVAGVVLISSWTFAMKMVVWEKLIGMEFISIISILISSALCFISGFMVMFRKASDGSAKISARIFSIAILSIVTFSLLAFFGLGMKAIGLSIVMGSMLGFFMVYFIFNIMRSKREVDDDNEDEWNNRRPGI